MKKTLSLLFLSISFLASTQNVDTIDVNSNEGEVGGHTYVDLGLPSGILWASCNIGSDSTYIRGDFFAWGEISPREDFYWTNYDFYEGITENDNSEYILENIGDDISGTKYDAAHCLWGSGWRMPSTLELEELLSCCQTEFISSPYAIGLRMTGPNGNTLFLPITLYPGNNYTPATIFGNYWSSTLEDTDNGNNAMALHFASSNPDIVKKSRYEGLNIRPVIHPQDIPSGVATISASEPALSYRDGAVFVDRCLEGDIISVADLSGRRVCSLSPVVDRCQLPRLEPGIYVITLHRNAQQISSLKISVR